MIVFANAITDRHSLKDERRLHFHLSSAVAIASALRRRISPAGGAFVDNGFLVQRLLAMNFCVATTSLRHAGSSPAIALGDEICLELEFWSEFTQPCQRFGENRIDAEDGPMPRIFEQSESYANHAT